MALVAAFLAVFLVTTFLMGSRARARRRRELERRLGRRGGSKDEGSTGAHWVPEPLAQVGHRFAEASGFAERLDARLEQAGMPVLAGEFVYGGEDHVSFRERGTPFAAPPE